MPIIGIDDIAASSALSPSLSAVARPKREIGARASWLLLDSAGFFLPAPQPRLACDVNNIGNIPPHRFMNRVKDPASEPDGHTRTNSRLQTTAPTPARYAARHHHPGRQPADLPGHQRAG
ncbi:MAG: hypothetical protein IT325_12410, partial [Anaerolineae bacterium]|nr:hypothetical protein [Anaerolineae bacterium]